MNIRKITKNDEYYIALDEGTGSVGWAVTDADGKLLTIHGRPTWGSRLFGGAETAAEARAHRGQRRRIIRRRWRLSLLQSFFEDEVSKIDPEFFIRLNQVSLVKEDRTYDGALDGVRTFNGGDYTDEQYAKDFPTIYHLRQHLLESDEPADIRLVYLALHHIVKYRGNFLQESISHLSAKNANCSYSINEFVQAFSGWLEKYGLESDVDSLQLVRILEEKINEQGEHVYKKDRQKSFAEALSKSINCSDKELNKLLSAACTQLSNLMVGYKGDAAKIFFDEGVVPADIDLRISLSAEGDPDKVRDLLSDVDAELFESINNVYQSFILQGILTQDGLSKSMVASYEKYKTDLATLKRLVRRYCKEKYDECFKGELLANGKYNPRSAKGYSMYNLGESLLGSRAKNDPMNYDAFMGYVVKMFAKTDALEDPEYLQMMAEFGEQEFLVRQRTSKNGAIPFQLHLEELSHIVEKQGKYYPWLLENKEKLESLVRFRIPYYVGPLTQTSAAKDSQGNNRFAWSERREGMQSEKVYPWNWEQVIDTTKTAENFIGRMTGMCTYLIQEPVLPKESILYQEFCVLNELNGASWTEDGDRYHRFDYSLRQNIFEDLFCKKQTISYKTIKDYIKQQSIAASPDIRGAQGETGFESKMSSYIFFTRDVFKVEELSVRQREIAENLIYWNTIFEDKKILKKKITEAYGDVLSENQIKQVMKKRFKGWGRLSKKLLCELKVNVGNGPISVMDIMRDGDQLNTPIGRSMIFQEIITDNHYGFNTLIEEQNTKALSEASMSVADLPGSPQVRRTVNQSLKIIDEIIKTAHGVLPKAIFLETTHDEKEKVRTTQRIDAIRAALKELEASGQTISSDVRNVVPKKKTTEKLSDLAMDYRTSEERLVLYLLQNGRCMYSGKPLDIHRLESYQVDHIIPQCYRKDDSIDNKVLVIAAENQRKLDNLLLDSSVQWKMRSMWEHLHNAGAISDKKFKSLTRTDISELQIGGFIARQLVETGQSVKFTRMLLQQNYPEVPVYGIKAGISHELREKLDIQKCRELNDYHHAHDAYLASMVGRFVLNNMPSVYENPVLYAKSVKAAIQKAQSEGKDFKQFKQMSYFTYRMVNVEKVDTETGEVLWQPEPEIVQLKKTLNYRDCFITRLVTEVTGGFWDATIYSPKTTPKDLTLPVKQGLDPKVYGGYSRETAAYYFLYETSKKGVKSYGLAGVPVYLAKSLNDEDLHVKLEEIVNSILKKGEVFERIVVDKIYNSQLVEFDNQRIQIRGFQEGRNAIELAFSIEEVNIVKKWIKKKPVSEDEIASLWLKLFEILPKIAPETDLLLEKVSVKEKLGDIEQMEIQRNLYLGIVAHANGADQKVDLTPAGGKAFAGVNRLSALKSWWAEGRDSWIIDQSVTGMFERRRKIVL